MTDSPSLGLRALAILLTQVGVREQGAPNRGKQVDAYERPSGMLGQPWCSDLQSWARLSALLAGEVDPLGYRASVAGTWAAARGLGWARDASYAPKPGDYAIYRRGGGDPRVGGTGHIRAVVSVPDGYGTWWGCGGNEADSVIKAEHSIHDSDLVGWIAFG